MDKRSWPWKKKTSAKSSTSTDHQADDKIRHLNERLVTADDLAKQHATVAEEAVAGWEKSKAESMSLKYQLDVALEQKEAAEVRVFHLDGALKDCMQQLRQVREEQEQSIHEAIVKRSREWDRLRLDLEERLAAAEGQLTRLKNEKILLDKKVQEQTEAIAELGRTNSKAEGEIVKLHIQVQALEKENTSLKYEIVVLSKELGIRNQEREMNKRALDMASQHQNENTKRTAKLEAECQRLRTLVRKKLPGPGALLQMKLEAGIDAERGDFGSKRRSSSRVATSPKAAHPASTTDKLSPMFQRSPRMTFMGPRLHVTQSNHSQEFTQVSLSEDGIDDDDESVADSWTSGMTAEPAYFRKEGFICQQLNNNHAAEAIEKLNSIDDFLELERLVSLPSENQGVKPTAKVQQSPSSISDQVLSKDAELQAANKVSEKYVVEEQRNLLRSKNTASEKLKLFSLQQKLLKILDSPERRDTEMVLENVRKAVIDSRCSSVNGVQAQVMDRFRETACDQSSNAHLGDSSLVETWICKVIHTVEDLATKSIVDFKDSQASDHVTGQDIQSKPKLQLSELEANVKNFVAVANSYLYGKAELVQFMAELYSVLEPLNTLFRTYKLFSGRMKWRPEAVQHAEQEVFSDAGSPFSLSCSSDRSDSLAHKDSSAEERVVSGKFQVERAALESRSKEKVSGVASVQHVIAELKQDKVELENKLGEERGKLERMKYQLLHSEQLVVTLRARLASAELSGIVAEKSLSSITAVKAQLELRLEDCLRELARLREKLKSLEILYDQEKKRNNELQMKSEELRALQRAVPCRLQEDTETSNKEPDIADATEKLAECQRTILVLGQQLKDIVSAQDANSVPPHLDQVHENAAIAQLLQPCNSMSNWQEAKQRSPSHPEAYVSDTFTESPKSTGCGLEVQAVNEHGLIEAHGDVSKQLVPYVPERASRKKLNLRPFAGSGMSKSLNLEPSASPRKHGNSFKQLFSRHKCPS